MSRNESSYSALNPEGQAVVLESAQRMADDLNEMSDGENTDISGAPGLLREAREMCADLEKLTGAGPEVSQMIGKLHDAIDHLNAAIKQVH